MAYLKSLTRLETNVVSEVGVAIRALAVGETGQVAKALQRITEQVSADCREVRADVECMAEGMQW